ncbi:MAG: hypothetical protein COV47_03530 [Candidatus Diapherotrites archaeon CG11_big_fil_rev_8_21_14_0_20_37_9]|nr:MAG: hypothetical protein COV47_03530 [Candidatus Diapherotrites archaeon CG11_big_fil_rev_8_21_14_0_20_37_9]
MPKELSFTDSPKNSIAVEFLFLGQKNAHKVPDSFTGKKFDSIFFPEKNLILIGLGDKALVIDDYYRRAAAKAVKTASFYRISKIHFSCGSISEKTINAILEGAYLANYSFDKYKTDPEKKVFRVKEISFPMSAKKFSVTLNETLKVCQNVFIARDLVSENSDVVTPKFFEYYSRKIAKSKDIKVTVLRENQLKKLGFNLLLNVSKGASVDPRVIIFEYEGGNKNDQNILFAGKGVTFDSGGLNIKVGVSIKDMRMDMAGAANVIAIMKSASELKIKKNIVGIIGCVENLVDSESYRPGDVIKSYSGLTVENLNTDAEGRLVLADLLSFGSKKYNPEVIVEFSTLTGNVISCLGSYCAGMVSTNEKFADAMYKAGIDTYERVWRLPSFEEYIEETNGERADLRSVNKTRNNGSIYGGVFLSKFVNNVPFVHIDIAGTGMIEESKDYQPKDGTGFGVRLAIDFLKKI